MHVDMQAHGTFGEAGVEAYLSLRRQSLPAFQRPAAARIKGSHMAFLLVLTGLLDVGLTTAERRSSCLREERARASERECDNPRRPCAASDP